MKTKGKKRYLVLHAGAPGSATGLFEVKTFDGDSPTLEQLQAGVGGFIGPVDWIRIDHITDKPVAHLENVSFLANDDGIAMGLTLNVAVPYVASVERVSERTIRKKIRLCPIFGDIVAYIPRENGGGGLSDEQIEACFELFVRLRDIRDRFVFQKHQKEGNQDGDM